MVYSDSHRSGLLNAGGVLSIVAGVFQINNGAMLVLFFFTDGLTHMLAWEVLPFLPGLWFDFWLVPIPAMVGWRPSTEVFIMGLYLLILGILAITGGISAVRGKKFSLSLVGAICAIASGLPGILAVIFIALRKREFRKESLNSI